MILGISGTDGLTTVLGIVIVFIILAFLVGVLITMEILPRVLKKKFPHLFDPKKHADKDKTDEIAASASVEPSDDTELVAVITAAVYALLEKENGGEKPRAKAPFIVKSIKRI